MMDSAVRSSSFKILLLNRRRGWSDSLCNVEIVLAVNLSLTEETLI